MFPMLLRAALAVLLSFTLPCPAGVTAKPVGTKATAAAVSGRVVGITDGDTLAVLIDQTPVKIRLEGIDAPEKRQAFGSASKAALSALVAGCTVSIAPTGKDRYGRTLARVHCGGVDVGREMIRQGMAWHFIRYNQDADLAGAEMAARGAKRGLWADKAPVAPWEWRKARAE